MPACEYPNCRQPQQWVPVIEIPTMRTVGETDEWVRTDQPTQIVGQPVCETHRQTFTLTDWVSAADWGAIQEAAHTRGYKVLDREVVVVRFMPAWWTPERVIEVQR